MSPSSRSYTTRHLRFPRALDVALRERAARYRRRFNELVVLMLEGWLEEHPADESGGPLDVPRRPRQARKPSRKP